MAQVRHYLSFRVGNEWYGVDVDSVIQVLHFVALTELPGARPDVLGLITVREQIIPVIDLRRHFRLVSDDLRLDTPIIAVRSERGPVALVVDEAEDVLTVEPQQVSSYDGTESSYVKGVIRLKSRLLLLLDAAYLRSRVPNQLIEAALEVA